MTREEASKILHVLWVYYHHYLTEKEAEAVDMAIEALKQPEQKKGKWINPSRNPEYVNKEFFSDCSVCGFTTMDEKKECPNCGAYMETDK